MMLAVALCMQWHLLLTDSLPGQSFIYLHDAGRLNLLAGYIFTDTRNTVQDYELTML